MLDPGGLGTAGRSGRVQHIARSLGAADSNSTSLAKSPARLVLKHQKGPAVSKDGRNPALVTISGAAESAT